MPSWRSSITELLVTSLPGAPHRGLLRAGHRALPCALGRTGIGIKRREGDGVTPRGTFALTQVLVRPDRFPALASALPLATIEQQDGWCDATGHRLYNRPVTLPFEASHEEMWRDDALYDCVIVLDFNMTRRLTRGGSAIFFHIARDDYGATEGCVAIAEDHMRWLLPRLSTKAIMTIG